MDKSKSKALQDILKPLMSQTYIDHLTLWDEWLKYLCASLDFKNVMNYGGYAGVFYKAKQNNDNYFMAMRNWIEFAEYKINADGPFDSFGCLYEENFQTSYKASKSGQFFTPESLCLCMANTIEQDSKQPTEEVIISEDMACGSGRTLIQFFSAADRCNRLLFSAGDIDIASVRMCALNFFICGMVGQVSQMDSLSGDWRCGFIVNACRVPKYNICPSLEYFEDRNVFESRWQNLKSLAENWDIVNHRTK